MIKTETSWSVGSPACSKRSRAARETRSRHRRREREFALALRGAPATINSILVHRAGVPDPLTVDAAHTEVFDFKEFLDAVFRAFAADAAFLHAAERGDLGRDDAFVDADDAVFEGLRDAPDTADVAAVEIGGQAEFGVVGHLDGLGVGLEAVERRDRAEGFLLGDDHVGRHIGQYRRLEEA